MRNLILALAAGLALSEMAMGEVIEISPEKVEGLPVDLLTGIQFAQNDHGFKRDELYLDLLRPVTDTPTPVIVFVLGSGWSPIERERVLPQLTFLAEAGFAVATIDYRGIGEATFPEPEMDVKAAIRFLRANADRYNIDPDAIGLFGNSAGGHLALMAALTDETAFEDGRGPDVSPAIQAVAALYPALYFGEGGGGSPFGASSLHLGLDVNDPANADAVATATPATHIDAGDPPVLLIHGTADEIVPVTQSERMHDALVAEDVDASLLRVEGLGHSIEDAMKVRQVRERLVGFFTETLGQG
jgi:acetyl esterase/lipase